MLRALILAADKNGSKLPAPRTDVPSDHVGRIQLGAGEFSANAVTMRHLARALWLELELPVVDQTHIRGHYDFKIRFAATNRDLGADKDDGTNSSIFPALRSLGLRLDSAKLPIDVLIIESAARPTEN